LRVFLVIPAIRGDAVGNEATLITLPERHFIGYVALIVIIRRGAFSLA
jgi:hypothetical protein